MISGWSACRTRIEDGLRALRKRGQSETLGVALLTGVVLILVAVVGLFLFADFGASDEEQLLANIDGDVEATNVTLSHEGGDEFAPGEIEVVLTGDVSRELRLNESFDATTGGDGSFAPGDVWKSDSAGLIVGEGRLLVIHERSDTILLDQPYAIEVDGVDLAVENHPTGNYRSDSATVHGNETWGYELSATLGGTSYDEADDITYNISFSGPGAQYVDWTDNSNHVIEVFDNVTGETNATATATIFQENGDALNETGEVELTVSGGLPGYLQNLSTDTGNLTGGVFVEKVDGERVALSEGDKLSDVLDKNLSDIGEDGAFVWWAVNNASVDYIVSKENPEADGPTSALNIDESYKLGDTGYYARNPDGAGTPQPWQGDATLTNVTITRGELSEDSARLVTEWST